MKDKLYHILDYQTESPVVRNLTRDQAESYIDENKGKLFLIEEVANDR